MKASHVLMFLLVSSVVACGGKKKTNASPSPFAVPADVYGKWQTPCTLLDNSGGAYELRTLELNAADYKSNIAVYTDAACTQAFPGNPTEMSGAYAIAGADAFLPGAIDINIEFTDIDGSKKTGYSIVLIENGMLYMGDYLGLNEQSRPQTADKAHGYLKVADPAPVPNPNPQPVADLTGHWATACVAGSSANDYYMIQALDFTGASLNQSTTIYMDAACTQAATSYGTSGTYKLEGVDSGLSGGLDVYLDLHDQNGQTYSGYGLLQIENNTLYMGSYLGGNTASRPTSVDRTVGYVKH